MFKTVINGSFSRFINESSFERKKIDETKKFDTLIVIDLRYYKPFVERFLPIFRKIAFELCCDSNN